MADALQDFLTEIKVVEQQESQWTSEKQIHRLTKPGSKYLNLNPYEVLQMEPTASEGEIKKQYRKLCLLIHPDKNLNDRENAQRAFDVVNEAHKIINDEEKKAPILDRINEAKEKLKHDMEEARKKSPNGIIPEDNPIAYQLTLRKETIKLFAFYEKRKLDLEQQDQRIRKRERELEIEEENKKRAKRDFQKAWDSGRDDRMDSWQSFAKGKTKKKASIGMKPPKLKAESRET